MALIVAGSRSLPFAFINVRMEVKRAIDIFGQPSIILHGDSGNADKAGQKVADALGIEARRFPYPSGAGKAGGPMRNGEMIAAALEYEDAVLVALLERGVPCRGTRDIIQKAAKAGIGLRVETITP